MTRRRLTALRRYLSSVARENWALVLPTAAYPAGVFLLERLLGPRNLMIARWTLDGLGAFLAVFLLACTGGS